MSVRAPVFTALGWTAAVPLAVPTVVLAGMLPVVPVWLTVAVPVVALLLVVGLAADAYRG